MKLTTSQAAKMIGVSKRTIQNNINQGKLSAERDKNGFYSIDLSEILRAYPAAKTRVKNEAFAQETEKEQ